MKGIMRWFPRNQIIIITIIITIFITTITITITTTIIIIITMNNLTNPFKDRIPNTISILQVFVTSIEIRKMVETFITIEKVMIIAI